MFIKMSQRQRHSHCPTAAALNAHPEESPRTIEHFTSLMTRNSASLSPVPCERRLRSTSDGKYAVSGKKKGFPRFYRGSVTQPGDSANDVRAEQQSRWLPNRVWRLSLCNADYAGCNVETLPGDWMSIEPAETPEPRRTGHREWDLLASVVAITISAASLYTAYHTSHSMERLVHASSWPALQLDSSNETAEGEAALTFDIHNTGVGPAQIQDFKILVDGQPVSSQGWLIDNLTKSCCNEARTEALAAAGGNRQAILGPDTTNPVASRSLAPNERISALRWPKTDSNAVLWRQVDLARQSGRIQMRACYCSVFDECWAANSHKFPQRPVRSCN